MNGIAALQVFGYRVSIQRFACAGLDCPLTQFGRVRTLIAVPAFRVCPACFVLIGVMVRSRRHFRRRAVAAIRTSFRIVTLICVSASLWRAPLPCFHEHHDSVQQAGAGPLASHLTAMHAADEPHDDCWHVHYAMLEDIVRGGGYPIPADESDDERPSPFEQQVTPELHAASGTLVHPSRFARTAELTPSELLLLPARRSHAARRLPADHFRAPPRRLQSVLCVVQC